MRCYTLNGYVYYPSKSSAPTGEVLHVEPGRTLSNIDFRIAPFKKGTWKTYGPLDGLGVNVVWSMYQDRDGAMWFGTWGGGVSRYDGKTFTTFTTKDGLADNQVTAIHQDTDGVMWFGTWRGGVSR